MRAIGVAIGSAVACLWAAPASPQAGMVLSPGQPAKAGGPQRELYYITSRNDRFPSGMVTIEVQPTTTMSLSFAVWRLGKKPEDATELVRAVSRNGEAVALTFPYDREQFSGYFIQIVPTGSRFDTPPGRWLANPPQNGAAVVKLPRFTLVARDSNAPAFFTGKAAVAVAARGETSGGTVAGVTATPSAPRPASPVAVAQTAIAPPPGAAPHKVFASLLPYIGTHWTSPEQSTAFAIDWDRPNQSIVIRWDGLFGSGESIVVPAADGRSLRYVQRMAGIDGVTETMVRPRSNSMIFRAGDNQATCIPVKRQTNINCVIIGPVGMTNAQVQRTDAAGYAALVAKYPVKFPPRAKGQYHPTLGVLAEMAGRSWYPVGKPGDKPNGPAGGVEIGMAGNELFVVSEISQRAALLKGTATTQLRGTQAHPVNANPDKTVPYWLDVGKGGDSGICNSEYSNTACVRWHLSSDGETAMELGSVAQYYRAYRFPENRRMGVLARLEGRWFKMPGGASRSHWRSGDNVAGFTYYNDQGEVTSMCVFDFAANQHQCGYSTMQPVKLTVDDNSYSYGGDHWTLVGDENLTYLPAASNGARGKPVLYTPANRGMLALEWQGNWARRKYDDALAYYREWKREEAAERRASAARWGALAGQVASGAFNSNTWKPSTTADWQARIGSSVGGAGGGSSGGGSSGSAPSQAGGFAQSGGAVVFTPAPRMTPQQQAQADELARYQIRERIYGTGGGASAAATPSRAAPGATASTPRPTSGLKIDEQPCTKRLVMNNEAGCMVRYRLTAGFVGKTRNPTCYSAVKSILLPGDWTDKGDSYERFRTLIASEISRFRSTCTARLTGMKAVDGSPARLVSDYINLEYDLGGRGLVEHRPMPEDVIGAI